MMATAAQKIAGRFLVAPGSHVSLAGTDPRGDGGFDGKQAAKAQAAADADRINMLQDRLYAEGRRALLVVLQGMDCSGKDGTVRSVFNTCGPIGVTVTPFKVPTEEERARDYLWRIHRAVPARGFIGIFNRSHYEDVLVVKVKKLALAEAIESRYEEINQFEKLLHSNGTRILKFMLHISKEEQAERLKDRIKDETKRWKFNPGDLGDRDLWDEFMAAYETALSRCSTPHAPWYVIPADRQWVRNAAVARIVREALEEMDPQYPNPAWDPKAIKVK
jgi:PPK2 family polyphosphate:nucleotide phosphotransferase